MNYRTDLTNIRNGSLQCRLPPSEDIEPDRSNTSDMTTLA